MASEDFLILLLVVFKKFGDSSPRSFFLLSVRTVSFLMPILNTLAFSPHRLSSDTLSCVWAVAFYFTILVTLPPCFMMYTP